MTPLETESGKLDPYLLDLAFEPIFIRSFNGTISYWNKGATELYGYLTDEAVGANAHELLKTIFPLPRVEIEKQLERDGKWMGELIHTTRDGRKLIVESRHQLFEQPDGSRLVLETNRDITARETQYRTLFEGMQEGASYCRMVYDEQGQPFDWVYLDANPALERILGLNGIIGRRASELFPDLKKSTPDLLEMLGRVAKTGMPGVFEGHVCKPDLWLYVSAFSPGKNHFIAISKDITERKLAEGALAKSREQLKQFVEHMPAAVAMLDKELRYLSYSHRWLEEYGLEEKSLIGRHHYDVFPEIRNIPAWQAIHQRALAGSVERSEEDYFARADGTEIWLKWEVRPWFDLDGSIGGILVFSEDITARKLTEMELRQVKERLEHLLTAGPAVIYSCKPEGNFGATFISSNITRQLGYTPAEFLGNSSFWADRIHPDDAPGIFAELPKLFETGTHTHEYRFLHKDGSYRWMLDELRLLRDDQGQPLEIIGAWNDITGMKLAEEELRESEQSLNLALDAAGMGMWDWNLTTNALWQDEREQALFGYEPGEFTGKSDQAFDRIHPDDLESVKAEVLRAISENEPYQAEFRVVHPDGTVHWLAGRGQVINDEASSSQRMVGVNFDISDLKQAERERDKYTRMENVAQMHRLHVAGEFAALLAHQLNQPLSAIRSFAEASIAGLRRGKSEPEKLLGNLEDIVAQSERAAGSIRDLRKFLARQPQDKREADINGEVHAACSLMNVLARGRKVSIKQKLARGLPLLQMRTSQIEQVIINLMENAMDSINHAYPAGGSIEISTRLAEENRQIIIGILDSGPGLDDDTVARVFDPLYTTKKNGIGMGLAISRSIIEDHGGRIWAEPGPGGRFFFSLPVPQ